MLVHRAADIEQQQDLDRVVPLRAHADVEHAAFARGGGDGAVQIELIGGALACKATQAAQCQLDVEGADLALIVAIAELPLVPHLPRTPVAAPAPDAEAKPET